MEAQEETQTQMQAQAEAQSETQPEATAQIDVSVIVPCYNTERYLDAALVSAEQNDRCNLEIIVLNDGSTDGSLAIMQAHAKRDSRVRVIDKQNEGYGTSVNRGIDEARGTYVAILEPDDWVDPHMYDEMYEYACSFAKPAASASASSSDATVDTALLPDMVKTPYWRIVGCGTGHEERLNCIMYGRVNPATQPFKAAAAPRMLRHHPCIWSALYKREFLNSHGIRFMQVSGAGWVDTPFSYDTALQAERIVYLNKPFYCYREDLEGSSSNKRIGPLSFERWANMADIMERLGITDRGLLECLYYTGFRYITGARREGSLDAPDVVPLRDAMCERMDPALVVGMTDASPAARAYVLEKGGHEVPPMSKWPYYASLVSEFGASIKSNGLGFALSRIKLAFK